MKHNKPLTLFLPFSFSPFCLTFVHVCLLKSLQLELNGFTVARQRLAPQNGVGEKHKKI